MITATRPEISAVNRKRSLEVRWILPGPPGAAVTEWFARFEAAVEAREDTYLLDPRLPGVAVKLRSGRALEVKVCQGSPGILEVAGCARGRLESWDKWSFPHDQLGQGGAARPGWCPVGKLIRRFTLAGPGGARVPGLDEEAGCEVELTEVRVRGQAWWTLGFEATGPASRLRGELETAAAQVFAQVLPGGVELGTGNSQSYAQWLTGGEMPGCLQSSPSRSAHSSKVSSG